MNANSQWRTFPSRPEELATLIKLVAGGDLDNTRARDVFQAMVESGDTAEAAMASLGIERVDDSALENLCRELLAANPQTIADVQAGKTKAVGALIGQAKKKNPNVNPGEVRRICLELIEAMG